MARKLTRGEQRPRFLVVMLLGLALATAVAAPARAAQMSEAAHLSGPDRLQTLMDGARKEGGLTLYSSATVDDMAAIIAGFEKSYGLKVRTWRGSSEDIRQRAITEARGDRFDADVLETAGPDLEAVQREGLLQEMVSPTLADLVPGALRPHREWVSSRLSTYVAAYNTTLIRKADAPAAYEDLLDPRWRGKLGIEAEDSGWFMTYAGIVGEQKAIDLFKRIVQTNGVSVRKGHTLLANLVVAGEVPLGLTVYGYRADQLAHGGAPLQPLSLGPLVALPTGIAVTRRAPHPFAAALFWEYFLTEGQKVLASQDNLPVNLRVKAPPAGLVMLDPAKLIDDGDRWTRIFKEVFTSRGR